MILVDQSFWRLLVGHVTSSRDEPCGVLGKMRGSGGPWKEEKEQKVEGEDLDS